MPRGAPCCTISRSRGSIFGIELGGVGGEVTDNSVGGARIGIWVRGANYFIARNGSNGNSRVGIWVTGLGGNRLEENIVNNNGQVGISLGANGPIARLTQFFLNFGARPLAISWWRNTALNNGEVDIQEDPRELGCPDDDNS